MTDRRIPLAAALVTLVVHAVGNPHYGFFRDELYFIICGLHPAWGYVDQPPVVPLLAAGSQLFGHSLFAIRFVAALLAAAGMYATCMLAIEFGAGLYGQFVAAVAYLFGGVTMIFGSKLGPDTVGLWLWPLAALFIVRIVKGGDPRLWLAAGATLGLSFESKYSVLFFGTALLLGTLVSPQRNVMRTPWFAAGMALAAAIALPNVLWQYAHDFPMWELLRNGEAERNVNVGPLEYAVQQVLVANPLIAPIWIAGLIWLLRSDRFRFLGYTYIVLMLLMMIFHGKHYYPGDVYPIVMAAGGVAVERWTVGLRWVRYALGVAMVAAAASLPFSLPILSEPAMLAYTDWVKGDLHVRSASLATIREASSALPTDWADMHGWPQLAQTVARVYESLPPQERSEAAIYTSNYGEASAIDFFGKAYGLPPAVSGHNNYWIWGPRGYSGNVVIDVNGDCDASQHLYRTTRLATRFEAPWVLSFERNIPISVCTGIREPLATLWPQLRNYI